MVVKGRWSTLPSLGTSAFGPSLVLVSLATSTDNSDALFLGHIQKSTIRHLWWPFLRVVASVCSCCRISWYTCSRWVFWSSDSNLGTILAHTFLIPKLSTKMLLTNSLSIPSWSAHYANGEAAVGAHQFSHLFDVDISFDAASPSRFSIILHTQPTIHKPLMPTQRLLSETCKNRRIPQATC